MGKHTPVPEERRALQVLFDTYWTSEGWRRTKDCRTPPEDFALAKQAGVMFDPILLSHADVVERANAGVRGVERQAVADAFVFSLSSRRLEYRSALGSFAVLQHFPRHASDFQQEQCALCGYCDRSPEAVGLNVLNFERYKWGGVRHDDPVYAGLDLQLFRKLPRVVPMAADVAVFKHLLRKIEDAPAETSAASLEKNLARAFKSNKSERDIVVGILGLCGVLSTAAHPGYRQTFVPWSKRELPSRHFVDMTYPACWWRRSDGINQEALTYWFGHLLN